MTRSQRGQRLWHVGSVVSPGFAPLVMLPGRWQVRQRVQTGRKVERPDHAPNRLVMSVCEGGAAHCDIVSESCTILYTHGVLHDETWRR